MTVQFKENDLNVMTMNCTFKTNAAKITVYETYYYDHVLRLQENHIIEIKIIRFEIRTQLLYTITLICGTYSDQL